MTKLDAGLMTSLPASDPGSTAVWGSKRINPRPQSCLCLAWSGYPSNDDDDDDDDVYHFSCPYDGGLTYIGKSTRHVVTRAKEHLKLGSSVKSKIKEHIIECNLCNKKNMDSLIHRFIIIKKCS